MQGFFTNFYNFSAKCFKVMRYYFLLSVYSTCLNAAKFPALSAASKALRCFSHGCSFFFAARNTVNAGALHALTVI